MKKKWIIIISIVVVLVVLRLVAPYVLVNYLNNELTSMEQYKGTITDIDLRLYKATVLINEIYFVKADADFPDPFIEVQQVTATLDWNALFGYGKIAAAITVGNAVVNAAVGWSDKENGEKVKQFGTGVDWIGFFRELSPISFNKIKVNNFIFNYSDYTTEPQIHVYLDNGRMVASNLQNLEHSNDSLPGKIDVSAHTLGDGSLTLKASLNMLNKPMDLSLNLIMEDVDMAAWKDLTEAYINIDFESGAFNLYSEATLINGSLDGYVKPVLENVRVVSREDRKDSFLDKAWEAIAGGLILLFENKEEEEFSSRIEISGEMTDVEVDIMGFIGGLFKNAFGDAFNQELEHDLEKDNNQ